MNFIKKLLFYFELRFSKFDDLIIGSSDTYHHIDPLCNLNLDYVGRIYELKGTRFIWASEYMNSARADDFQGIWAVYKGHKVLLYDTDGYHISNARWKSLKGFNNNKSSMMILTMNLVANKNKQLLQQIQAEKDSLKKDRQHYIDAGLEDQYKKTYDVLLMNNQLIYSRQETIEIALDKATRIQGKIFEIETFIKNLEAREQRIKSLSSENLRLHSETANALLLIESKVSDIKCLRDICDGIAPIMDNHKVLQIKEAIKMTEEDFSQVFTQLELN